MNYFISVLTSFLTGIFTVELFLYFLAGFAVIAVIYLTLKIIYG